MIKLNELIDAVEPRLKNTVKFNPSIANIKDDYYLICFRGFARYPWIDIPPERMVASFNTNPNHPWLGGYSQGMWWNHGKGYDTTFFAVAKIDKSIGAKLSVKITKIFQKTLGGRDMRLFKYKDNLIYATYNVLIDTWDRKPGRFAGSCKERCDLIEGSTIQVLYDDKAISDIHIEPVRRKDGSVAVLCLDQSTRTEKNWSLWLRYTDEEEKMDISNKDQYEMDHSIIFSYALVPKHYILSSGSDAENCYFSSSDSPTTLLNNLITLYNNQLFVSLSTPAINISDLTHDDSSLAVGHMKIRYKELFANEFSHIKNTSLVKLLQQIALRKNIRLQPNYIYFMFFYTFSRKNLNIDKISFATILFCDRYALTFPSGLSRLGDDTFIIAYGNSDVESNLVFTSFNYIKNILYDIDSIDPYEYNFSCSGE